jgi:Holliday junction resolvase RusA-like endonuclease
MTASLVFTVPGPPVATARAGRHFNPKTGKAHSFTPAKTADFKNQVRLEFHCAYPNFIPVSGPISMNLKIYMPIPQSMTKRERAIAESDETALPHIKKPDGKNIRWGIEDALEGLAFVNDSQVCKYSDSKTYSPRPRVEISISQIQLPTGADNKS